MHRRAILLALSSFTLAGLLACNLMSAVAPEPEADPTGTNPIQAQTLAETTETETQEPPTPAPTSEPSATPLSGIEVSTRGLTLRIPEGIASGGTPVVIPQAGPDQELPEFGINPTYLEVDLEGYALQGTFHSPVIRVYPVDAYRAVSPEYASGIIDRLASIIQSGNPGEDSLPFLPIFNAAQVFHTRAEMLSFQNGSGLRYLTEYAQAFVPISNDAMFYTFQGMTSDQRYYVSVLLPVSASFLQNTGELDEVPPADGVAFPPFESEEFSNLLPVYLEQVTQKLTDAPVDAFTPNLDHLDALVESILIQTLELQ